MGAKRYYPEMDRLRGIAILMVLLYHSILVYPIDLPAKYPWCDTLHSLLWTVEMPIFFLVSGFCFKYEGHYIGYLKKKVLRILLPHIVFGMLDMLIRMTPTVLVRENFDAWDAFVEFVIYGANDWFLVTLFWIFLIAPLLYRLQCTGRAGKIIVVTLAVVANLLQNLVTGVFCMRNVVQFTVFFVIGMVWRERGIRQTQTESSLEAENDLCRDEADKKKLKSMPIVKFASALIFGVIGFVLMPWYGWTGLEEEWRKVFHGGIMMKIREKLDFHFLPGITWVKIIYLSLCLITTLLLCYVVYVLISRMKEGVFDRFLKICSKYSLQMYLLDGYALTATRILFVSVLGIQSPFLIIPLNFIVDTAIVLVISRLILKRWKVLRIVSGLDNGKLN